MPAATSRAHVRFWHEISAASGSDVPVDARRRVSGSSGGPSALTSANLVRAMQGHGFTQVRAETGRNTFVQCDALTGPKSVSVGGYGRFGASGMLDVKPLKLRLDTARTGAVIMLLSKPAVAAACGKQMLAIDRPGSFTRRLTDDMVEAPSSGGPGSPMMQNGVVTDGSYEIIGSQGRFLLLGIATNRPDADRIERSLRVVAGSFGES